MAEAFGIVSGAVGIASAFSTCVECFDYVQLGRRFGKDFQTDQLTLSLLKLRLSRWGAAVGVESDPPLSLSQPNASAAEIAVAKDTMLQMLVLFADSEKVSRRYDLSGQQPGEDSSALTEADMEALLSALDNRMRRLAERRQKRAGLLKITRWALYDKEHYARLVEGITKLLDALDQAFPTPEKRAAALAQEELEEVSRGHGDRQEDQAMILKVLQDLATGVDEVIKAKVPVVAAGNGISIGSIVIQDGARSRTGNFVGSAWKGVDKLPRSENSITIGSIQATGNSRVMNGDTYADRDNFWD
ncbi:prion-inhibition and propagation-domain-containing protein [Ustulina deusta]|nr:prion-inhibition and propagation-domain-containing protein [Ustulina deusta]